MELREDRTCYKTPEQRAVLLELFFLGRTSAAFDFQTVYADAVAKDAIFDDPATAAYAIESNLNMARQEHMLWPNLTGPFVFDELIAWYAQLLERVYGLQEHT